MTELLKAALESALRARRDLQTEVNELEQANSRLERRIRELERLNNGYQRRDI